MSGGRVMNEERREPAEDRVRDVTEHRLLRPGTVALRSLLCELVEILKPHSGKQRDLEPIGDRPPRHRFLRRRLGGMENLSVCREAGWDEAVRLSMLQGSFCQPRGGCHVLRETQTRRELRRHPLMSKGWRGVGADRRD